MIESTAYVEVHFTSMNARLGSSVAKLEGMERGAMKKNVNLYRAWRIDRIQKKHFEYGGNWRVSNPRASGRINSRGQSRQSGGADRQRSDDSEHFPGTVASLRSAGCDCAFSLKVVVSTRRFARDIWSLGASLSETHGPLTVSTNRIPRGFGPALPSHRKRRVPRSAWSVCEQASACAIGPSGRTLKAGPGRH
jgi:hypothetical protein